MSVEEAAATPVLFSRDCEIYSDQYIRNEDFNPQRLEIRRRLDAIAKSMVKKLSKKTQSLVSRASLHHPYKFNGFKVSSQFCYLSRGEKERKALKSILGVDLGKDLDQNLTHVVLVLQVDKDGFEIALRIHKDAWWDAENFKRKCKDPAEREKIAELMRQCPAFSLQIDNFRNLHSAATMTEGELAETLEYYQPGNHWLHFKQRFEADHSFWDEAGQLERIQSEFVSLMPLYEAICWSKKNNLLFA